MLSCITKNSDAPLVLLETCSTQTGAIKLVEMLTFLTDAFTTSWCLPMQLLDN